jgi:oligoribonuclease NrnB/cAMP/cGMP phosphodiesterase (DHH superfamily)
MTFPIISDNPSPTVVLYHADCPDGFGAAWALHRSLGEYATYLPIHYGSKLDLDRMAGQHVLMVDVSLPEQALMALHKVASSFVLIDHHKTAAQNLGHLPFCHFDMNRSGAGIAWDYANPGQARPPLIDLVEARDLYRWDTVNDARALGKALDVEGYDFHGWERFNQRMEDAQERIKLVEEGQGMCRLFNFQVEEFCKSAIEIQQQGRQGFAVGVPHMFASDVASRLSARAPGAFGFTWCLTKEGDAIRASWRSAHADHPIDALAGEYGGGGHPMASGAVMEWSQLQSLLASRQAFQHKPKAPHR